MKKFLSALFILVFVATVSFAQVKVLYIQGTESMYDVSKIAPGKVVVAYNQLGIKLAETTVQNYGEYTLTLYQADPEKGTYGYLPDDTIRLYVDGIEVKSKDENTYTYPIIPGDNSLINFEFVVVGKEITKTYVMNYFKSENTFLNGGKAPVGTKVSVYMENGKKVGEGECNDNGSFNITVYGDDPLTADFKEGPVKGEKLYFYLDGVLAKVIGGDDTFGDNYDEKTVDLYASTARASSPLWCNYAGVVYINGEMAEPGTVIKVVDKDGIICGGPYVLNSYGNFDIMVSGDDSNTSMVLNDIEVLDEGADLGETVTFYIKPVEGRDYLEATAEPADHKFENQGSISGLKLSVEYGNKIVETSKFCDFVSSDSKINGLLLPPSTVVKAYAFVNGKLVLCGETTVSEYGSFSLRVYGDDENTEYIEGPTANGEKVYFTINDMPANIEKGDNTFEELGSKNITLYIPVEVVAPMNVTAEDLADEPKIKVTWDAVDDVNLKEYKVYRKVNGGDAEFLTTTTETEYLDANIEDGQKYEYGVSAVNIYGTESDISWSSEVTAVDVVENTNINKKFDLGQNYPNPFNSMTVIPFSLNESKKVSIKIYNVLGQEVRTLVNNKIFDSGSHKVTWNGKDNNGKSVPTGVYYYRLESKDNVMIKKMIYMK